MPRPGLGSGTLGRPRDDADAENQAKDNPPGALCQGNPRGNHPRDGDKHEDQAEDCFHVITRGGEACLAPTGRRGAQTLRPRPLPGGAKRSLQ